MTQTMTARRMEQVIRTYIQACNNADAEAIAGCFCPDAVHYFPWQTKWLGALTIGGNFAKRVQEQGISWTVDQLLTDVDRSSTIMEWTRFNPQTGQNARGVDWFVFQPETCSIQEVRCYTAAPIHPEMARQELLDFDYAGRGYPATRD